MPAVSTEAQQPAALKAERRSFYRINDAVALKVNKLDSDVIDAARDRMRLRERELQVLAGSGESNAQLQKALRDVESKQPEVANLFRLFEARLGALEQLVASQEKGVEDSPNVVASLSGSGLGFDWPTAFFEGDHLLLEMTMFPSRYRVEALAKVIRGNPADRSTDGNFHCALEFVEIADTDREVLLQHVHNLQIVSLRSRNG